MELKTKIWLVDEAGHGFLGDGRYQLLREIGRQHSLQKAARQLGVSYRKAWGDVRAVERELGFAMLTRRRGGKGGGASSLTGRAEKLLNAYSRAKVNVEKLAQRQYERTIKTILQGKNDS